MCNIELWSGFLGTIFGAIIGGLIALSIARMQISQQKKRLDIKERKEMYEKEIQLLWQIFFDIKKDSEYSNIWNQYSLFLKGDVGQTKYIQVLLEFMLNDLLGYFNLIFEKGEKLKNENKDEIELLWQRSFHYLNSLGKIKDEFEKKYSGTASINMEAYFKKSLEIYQKHTGEIIL